jgi:hypothetical protein
MSIIAPRIRTIVFLVAAALALPGLITVMLLIRGHIEENAVALVLGSLVLILFIAVTAARLIFRIPLAPFTSIVMWIVSALTALSALTLGGALLVELNGDYCSDFFGSQASCLEVASWKLAISVLHPATLLILGVIASLALVTDIPHTKKSFTKKRKK